jgi:hypothetical protein
MTFGTFINEILSSSRPGSRRTIGSELVDEVFELAKRVKGGKLFVNLQELFYALDGLKKRKIGTVAEAALCFLELGSCPVCITKGNILFKICPKQDKQIEGQLVSRVTHYPVYDDGVLLYPQRQRSADGGTIKILWSVRHISKTDELVENAETLFSAGLHRNICVLHHPGGNVDREHLHVRVYNLDFRIKVRMPITSGVSSFYVGSQVNVNHLLLNPVQAEVITKLIHLVYKFCQAGNGGSVQLRKKYDYPVPLKNLYAGLIYSPTTFVSNLAIECAVALMIILQFESLPISVLRYVDSASKADGRLSFQLLWSRIVDIVSLIVYSFPERHYIIRNSFSRNAIPRFNGSVRAAKVPNQNFHLQVASVNRVTELLLASQDLTNDNAFIALGMVKEKGQWIRKIEPNEAWHSPQSSRGPVPMSYSVTSIPPSQNVSWPQPISIDIHVSVREAKAAVIKRILHDMPVNEVNLARLGRWLSET